MSFNTYNKVIQSSANSCGAFALAAALTDLGCPNMPANIPRLNTGNLALGYTVAPPFVESHSFGDVIYQTTGCLCINDDNTTAVYKYTTPLVDTNPPSALAFVAIQCGIAPANVIVNITPDTQIQFTGITLEQQGAAGDLYNTECNLINPPTYGTLVPNATYTHKPEPNECHLLLVNNAQHWIAINNTQVYDSATGFVGNYFFNDDIEFTTLTYTLPDNEVVICNLSGLWLQLSVPQQ